MYPAEGIFKCMWVSSERVGEKLDVPIEQNLEEDRGNETNQIVE